MNNELKTKDIVEGITFILMWIAWMVARQIDKKR